MNRISLMYFYVHGSVRAFLCGQFTFELMHTMGITCTANLAFCAHTSPKHNRVA